MQCSRRLLLAAVLAGHATCTSIRELRWYNSTATITAHFRRLATDHCGTRLRLNPELDGTVDWEGNAIQGALFTDGVRHEQNILRASKRRFLINFATHGRDYGAPRSRGLELRRTPLRPPHASVERAARTTAGVRSTRPRPPHDGGRPPNPPPPPVLPS